MAAAYYHDTTAVTYTGTVRADSTVSSTAWTGYTIVYRHAEHPTGGVEHIEFKTVNLTDWRGLAQCKRGFRKVAGPVRRKEILRIRSSI